MHLERKAGTTFGTAPHRAAPHGGAAFTVPATKVEGLAPGDTDPEVPTAAQSRAVPSGWRALPRPGLELAQQTAPTKVGSAKSQRFGV